MRHLTIALALAFAAPLTPSAAPLSRDRAVANAVANSPALAAASSRSEAAAADARGARGARLPTVDLAGTYHGTDSPAEVFALQLNQERFDKDAFFASDPNSPDWLDTWITSLEVKQPVYTGGELTARIGQADVAASVADHRLERARAQVAFDAAAAFHDLVTARERVAVLVAARGITAEHLSLAGSLAGQGMILDAEVLQAEVHLAEMDEMVVRARNGARLAEAALNLAMGQPLDAHWELERPPVPAPPDSDAQGMIGRALAGRSDLAAARMQLEAGRLSERVARSGFLPEVAVVGRYDLYDDRVLGANGRSGALMAVARINLFNGGSDEAALEAARSRSAASEHDVRRFEDGVRLEVERAFYDLEAATTRLETADRAVAAARETLRVRERRFRQGLDRMIDLQDAEIALREAEMRRVVARADVAGASLRLRFATGSPIAEEEVP